MNMNFYTFKRGTVIMADFSPQVGSELKGKHFAIVLNKKDNKYNELLTVVPLTSKEHKRHLNLGDEIKSSIYRIMWYVQNNVNKDINSINDPIEALELSTDFCELQLEVIERYMSLKDNTYAKINQITTISKRRIMKPINEIDPIRRLRVSDEILNKIDKKILETFTDIDIY